MLKYQKGRYPLCNNTNPDSFDLKKCNNSLYKNISNNTEFLYRKRCLFMTFKEYNEQKVHINNNIFCHVFPSINERKIYEVIITENKIFNDITTNNYNENLNPKLENLLKKLNKLIHF